MFIKLGTKNDRSILKIIPFTSKKDKMIFLKIAVSLNGVVNWELKRVRLSCLVDRSKIFVPFIFGK